MAQKGQIWPKNGILGHILAFWPNIEIFYQILAFWPIWFHARPKNNWNMPRWFFVMWVPKLGWLVVVARAISRKTPIYFIKYWRKPGKVDNGAVLSFGQNPLTCGCSFIAKHSTLESVVPLMIVYVLFGFKRQLSCSIALYLCM